jgi:hypothetical protein
MLILILSPSLQAPSIFSKSLASTLLLLILIILSPTYNPAQFFDAYLYGVDELPLKEAFEYVGVSCEFSHKKDDLSKLQGPNDLTSKLRNDQAVVGWTPTLGKEYGIM